MSLISNHFSYDTDIKIFLKGSDYKLLRWDNLDIIPMTIFDTA